jgi:hypothetical protein
MSLELISIGSSPSCGSIPCCCTFEVQTIGAFLPHRGYGKFNCDGSSIDFAESDGTTENPIKYLVYKTSGPAIVGGTCGGSAINKKDITQTWTIDPFYGGVGENNFTCYNGDEGVFSLCDPSVAEISSCSDTQRVYSCGGASEEEKEDFCIDDENFEKTWTESLENPYSLDDVASDVDSALSDVGFDNPKGTFGSIQFGTDNNKVLKWSTGGAFPEAKYQRGVGGVYKQKSKIKFLAPGSFKKITELDSGGVTEEELQVTEDQVITIDPPDEPGRIYISPVCAGSYLPTSISTSCDGTVSTKTLNINENCTFFTGPDCELYNTKTTVVDYERTLFATDSGYPEESQFESQEDITTINRTTIEKISSETNCYTETTEGIARYDSTLNFGECCDPDSGDLIPTVYTSFINLDIGNPENLTCRDYQFNNPDEIIYTGEDCNFDVDSTLLPAYVECSKNCDSTRTIEYNSSGDPTRIDGNGTLTINNNISVESNEVICSVNFSDYLVGELPGNIQEDTIETSAVITTTFSNTEIDEEDPGVETETCILGNNNCQPCNNCSSWYVSHNIDIKTAASVGFSASFSAPNVGLDENGQPNPPKEYITYIQTITRKDNTANSKCANRTFTESTNSYNNTSSGGEVTINIPPINLNVNKNESNCLIHVSAITFEVKSNE